jgi:DNA polymerase III alpha subunit
MDIEKLKALALAASPGPWSTDDPHIVYCEDDNDIIYLANTAELDTDYKTAICNASYIAAACPAAVLELIAEVERLRAAQTNSSSNFSSNCAAPAAGTVEKDAERLESAAEALRRAKRELDIIQARQAGSSAHVDAANHYQHAIVKLIDAAIEAHNARSPSCGS